MTPPAIVSPIPRPSTPVRPSLRTTLAGLVVLLAAAGLVIPTAAASTTTVSAPAAVAAKGADRGVGRPTGAVAQDRVTIPVSLAPGSPVDQQVVGWLQSPGDTRGRTLQVLLHGSTTNHSYWDLVPGDRRYSYVDRAARAGYATLNLDRLGSGESSRPAAGLVSTTSSAWTVTQVVNEVRSGSLAHLGFDDIVLVGWSQGSAVAIQAAADGADVDGLVITGFTHSQGPDGARFGEILWPVSLDPSPQLTGVPGDYLTTLPGQQAFFFNLDTTDPRILELAEENKDTTTVAEALGFVDVLTNPELSRAVHVPVLVVIGAEDTLFIDGPARDEVEQEQQFWSPAAQLQVRAVPRTGHALALHTTARQSARTITNWLDHTFDSTRS